jgi:hypothetical protein
MTTWIPKMVAMLSVAAVHSAQAANFVQRADSNHRLVGGMEIDVGVVDAARIRAVAMRGRAERASRFAVPAGEGYYRVNVSLLDGKSGDPIRDARVEARVEEVGFDGVTKPLRRMTIGDGASFANYFRMPAIDTYWIMVTVTRPGAPPAHATFEYRQTY